jgi:hypothetical protein
MLRIFKSEPLLFGDNLYYVALEYYPVILNTAFLRSCQGRDRTDISDLTGNAKPIHRNHCTCTNSSNYRKHY